MLSTRSTPLHNNATTCLSDTHCRCVRNAAPQSPTPTPPQGPPTGTRQWAPALLPCWHGLCVCQERMHASKGPPFPFRLLKHPTLARGGKGVLTPMIQHTDPVCPAIGHVMVQHAPAPRGWGTAQAQVTTWQPSPPQRLALAAAVRHTGYTHHPLATSPASAVHILDAGTAGMHLGACG